MQHQPHPPYLFNNAFEITLTVDAVINCFVTT